MSVQRVVRIGLGGFVLGLVCFGGADVLADEVTHGPYLQTGTEHSVVVCWYTDVPTDSRVAYGPNVGALNSMVDDVELVTDHFVLVDGLDAGTEYFYSVGTSNGTLAGGVAGYQFTTSPVVGSTESVRIWAIGDSGTGTDDARAVRDGFLGFSKNRPADLWMMLGDNAYLQGTKAEYKQRALDIYPSMLRSTVVWPVVGNHEVLSMDTDTELGGYYDVFSLPTGGQAGGVASGTELYYSFDYGNIHFVCLDSSLSDRFTGSEMLIWLSKDLAATDQTWLIGVWHYPMYSKGHNSDDAIHEKGSVELREHALPILEAAGVDLVLTAHSHSYERSAMLDGHYGFSSTFDPSTMVINGGNGQEDGDGVYAKPSAELTPHEGTVFVVAGASGRIDDAAYDHVANLVHVHELGSMVIDVEGTRLDAMFLNSDGVVRDHFTITKGPQVCAADLVPDGSLNFFDVSAFLVAFGKNDPIADFTNDGLWNFFDVSEFLTAFSMGCP